MNYTEFIKFVDKYGLGHILEGAFIYIPLLFIDSWIAFTAVSFFYLGRERRDYEISKNIPMEKWYADWNIFRWSKDCKMDLFPVTIFYLIITLIGEFIWKM